jgi:hypothetical protein
MVYIWQAQILYFFDVPSVNIACTSGKINNWIQALQESLQFNYLFISPLEHAIFAEGTSKNFTIVLVIISTISTWINISIILPTYHFKLLTVSEKWKLRCCTERLREVIHATRVTSTPGRLHCRAATGASLSRYPKSVIKAGFEQEFWQAGLKAHFSISPEIF